MGVDLNGLPFLGPIEALEISSGEWKRIDVLLYREQPDLYRAWRRAPLPPSPPPQKREP